jgi:hypothetical protein
MYDKSTLSTVWILVQGCGAALWTYWILIENFKLFKPVNLDYAAMAVTVLGAYFVITNTDLFISGVACVAFLVVIAYLYRRIRG